MSGPLRFTFVIARYGRDLLGGAERLARNVAGRLASRGHDVRVLTSCARSYATWANDYPPGPSLEDGVHIERYVVTRRRLPGVNVLKFFSSSLPRSSLVSRAWIRAQGPVVPELLERLPAEARERDVLVFLQLLTYTTLFGTPSVAEKCALVPLVHEERGIETELARLTLALPRALLVNTPEEADIIRAVAGLHTAPVQVVAVGLDRPPARPAHPPAVPQPYLTFMGRVGKMKPLLRTWYALMTQTGLPPLRAFGQSFAWRDVRLVIVGERSAEAARLRNVVQMGYVDDETRWDILRMTTALVNPSLYESLSLVLLEAWAVGRPVVVNARCHVTSGLVRRSDGGLALDFADPAAAARDIARALEEPERRNAMGQRGEAFATRTFEWDRVLDAYEAVARTISGRRFDG